MAVLLRGKAIQCLQPCAELRSLGADGKCSSHREISSGQGSAFFAGRLSSERRITASDQRRQRYSKLASRQRKITCSATEQSVGDVAQSGKEDRAAARSERRAECSSHAVGRRRVITLGAATAAAAVCPACSLIGPQKASAADWSYGTLSGPNTWGSICSVGNQQSPIDLPKDLEYVTTKSKWGSLEFQYAPVSPSFYNTGHGTMQVDFPKGGNKLILGNRTLELLQYHFHAPSEHSFQGQRTAMEAHLVHIDNTGKLAVVGVMMQADPRAPRNLCLQAALEFAPNEKLNRQPAPTSCFFRLDPEAQVCPSLVISPSNLLPKPSGDGKYAYMNYDGSLTTPPCSEGVDWFILANPVRIPGQQVIEFMNYVGERRTLSMNSRPVQPLNDRVVSMGP